MNELAALRAWTVRRWVAAAGAAIAIVLLIGLPTDVINNPVFGRTIAPTSWSLPVLILTALLGGLLAATYVRETPRSQVTDSSPTTNDPQEEGSRTGVIAGAISFFAIGCPVCNKLVLLALGSTGAVTWFAPIQPWLAAASIALMAYALRQRLTSQQVCAVPSGTLPSDRAANSV